MYCWKCVSTLYSACNLSKNQVLQLFFRQQRKSKPENFAIIVVTKTYLFSRSFVFVLSGRCACRRLEYRNMRNLLLLTALAVIFLTFVNGEELLGAQKCTWGPSYWCQGIRESSQCSATKHCIRKYWNSNPYPEDDDDVCKICKEMVKEARDQLESNQTQVCYIISLQKYSKVVYYYCFLIGAYFIYVALSVSDKRLSANSQRVVFRGLGLTFLRPPYTVVPEYLQLKKINLPAANSQ